MMTKRLLLLILLCLPVIVSANDKQTLLAEDRLRIRAYVEPEQRYYVGQQVRFFVEILTDSWFTTAPRYPEVRVPGAVAIDPERFSTNLTIREGARTFTGQRHGYLIYPQREGTLTIPSVSVTFAVSIDAKPSQSITLATKQVTIRAVMPPGVENALGLITAANVVVKESYQPRATELQVGDSITRIVTVSADDIQALVLPPIEFVDIEGLATYPGEPTLRNQTNRGQYRATRTDAVTYMVEQAGEYVLPPIELIWFDPASRRVRKPGLPERAFTAEPNPDAMLGGTTEEPEQAKDVNLEELTGRLLEWLADNLQLISLLVGGLYLLNLLNRRYRIGLIEYLQRKRLERATSPESYFKHLEAACRSGDPQAINNAFWQWMSAAGYHPQALRAAIDSEHMSAETTLMWQQLNYVLYAKNDEQKAPAASACLKGVREIRAALNQRPAVHGGGGIYTTLNPGGFS